MVTRTQTEAGPYEGEAIADPRTEPQRRARFFDSIDAFDLKLSRVPRCRFIDERDVALAEGAATGVALLDAAATLGTPYPATTPLVLARYLRVNAGERLDTAHVATGEIHYVIQGRGRTGTAGETVDWGPGDVLFTPGGATAHEAAGEDCVLWTVTNEPALAFEGLAPRPGAGEVDMVHYPAGAIAGQVAALAARPAHPDQAGAALIFAQARQVARRNIMPSFTLALNTLEPGGSQRAHRHNSVAVTLCVQSEGCWSRIDGERVDWAPLATLITPPGEVHSHHNEGPDRALFLIVQDGGWHYYARTMGFAFAE